MTPRRIVLAAGLWVAVLGILLAVTLYRAEATSRVLYRNAVAVGRYRARHAAERVGGELAGMQAVAHGLAGELESGRLPPSAVQARLGALLAEAPSGAERLGVLFRPPAPGGGHLFGPYATRDGAQIKLFRFEGVWGDYTLSPWFQPDQAGGSWLDPQWAKDAPVLRVDYLEPFRLPGAKAASGVVRLEVSLASMRQLIDDLGLGIAGYGFLVSANTALLVDPRVELVREGATLVALAEQSHDPGQARIAECALKGVAGVAEGISEVTGQKALTLLEPIRSVRWSVGVSLFEDELALVPKDRNRMALKAVSLALGMVWGLLFLGFGGPNLTLRSLWWTVAVGSLATVGGMGILFREAYRFPRVHRNAEIQVMDPVSLEHFKDQHGTLDQGSGGVAAEYILTGVFLQTLEITGPTQVKLTGMIWQRLPRGTPRGQRGVALPESTAGEVSLGPERPAGESVIQYYPFKVVVQPDMESSVDYPFDHTEARLRLWPKAWFGNQILVPDLSAYPLLAFGAGPGLDGELEVPGWKLEGAGFTYVLESYTTNFGGADFAGLRQSPELAYVIHLHRNYLGPCIVSFLPLLAVACLLFTQLLTVSQDQDRIKATGYGYFNLLRNVGGLFFTLVVAQFNIRGRIAADGVIYLEWFYFILYAAILAVSADALIFALDEDSWLRYQDNALPKLAFWPVLLGAFYLVAARYV
jgi:hypothetical protein